MQLPPIGLFARSPRTSTGYVAYRLFHGEEPPTLSVKDQVAIAITQQVVEGRLKPGQRISEQSIADEFNISKAPVSEALMLVEYTGLVESAARRSACVARMNTVDFQELMECRAALATVFFPRFADRYAPADRRVLNDYLDRMKELVSDDARAFDFVEVADRSILYIAAQAGNRRIAQAMSPLSLQLLRYCAIGVKSGKQRRQMLGWWSDAIRILDTRDVKAFSALAAQSRDTLIGMILDALRVLAEPDALR